MRAMLEMHPRRCGVPAMGSVHLEHGWSEYLDQYASYAVQPLQAAVASRLSLSRLSPHWYLSQYTSSSSSQPRRRFLPREERGDADDGVDNLHGTDRVGAVGVVVRYLFAPAAVKGNAKGNAERVGPRAPDVHLGVDDGGDAGNRTGDLVEREPQDARPVPQARGVGGGVRRRRREGVRRLRV